MALMFLLFLELPALYPDNIQEFDDDDEIVENNPVTLPGADNDRNCAPKESKLIIILG